MYTKFVFLLIVLFPLLGQADSGGIVGAISGALADAMSNNNEGTPDSDSSSDDD
jgi:uncharacterized membrane protein